MELPVTTVLVAVLLSSVSVRAQVPALQTPGAPPRDPRAQLPLTVTAVRIEGGDPFPAGSGVPRADLRNDGKLKILAYRLV